MKCCALLMFNWPEVVIQARSYKWAANHVGSLLALVRYASTLTEVAPAAIAAIEALHKLAPAARQGGTVGPLRPYWSRPRTPSRTRDAAYPARILLEERAKLHQTLIMPPRRSFSPNGVSPRSPFSPGCGSTLKTATWSATRGGSTVHTTLRGDLEDRSC